jgi:hypothetical protein
MGNTLTVGLFSPLHSTTRRTARSTTGTTAPTRTATTASRRRRRRVRGLSAHSLPRQKSAFFCSCFCSFPSSSLFSLLSSSLCAGGAGKHNWGTPEDERTAPTALDAGVSATLQVDSSLSLSLTSHSVRIPTTRTRTTSKNRPGLQVSPTCVIAFRSRPSHLRRAARRQRALRGSAPPARRARERQTRASSRRRKSRAL